MRPIRPFAAAVVVVVAAACGGGGGDGVTPPPQVASVVITSPAAAPTFGALARTVQFAAQARNADGAPVSGVTLSWGSTSPSVATVSGSGLVTAVGNGTTTITASGGGKVSTGVLVTVAQVGTSATVAPAAITFGSLGSTHQFAAQLLDSTGHALPSPNPVTWSVSAHGTIGVSNAGLVTALAVSVGAPDTLQAHVGPAALVVATPVTVTQVPASVSIAVPGGDSVLRTTGRTRQFTATARDSGGTVLATPPAFIWTVTLSGAASVNNVGLVTAIQDGTSSVNAFAGNASASRAQVVQRYAETFTLAPPSASITAPTGTQAFAVTAQDTNGTTLSTNWVSRAATVATVSPAAGAATTATATGNGTTFIVVSGGLRSDSAGLTVSNQPTAPTAIAVNVGDIFFRSVRNNSQNTAVDTLAVGGTVTWTWVGSANHTVQSTGTPTFTSSGVQSSGTYARTFNTAGTYTYNCAIHGAAMTGRIVVQ